MKYINIHTTEPSARLTYILDLLLGELNGISWRYLHNINDAESDLAVLQYQKIEATGSYPAIYAEGLLWEDHLRTEPVWFEGDVLFPSPQGYLMNFDVFSAAFYLVSRYEEYLSFGPDAHHRFPASESAQFKAGLLQKALVNHWARALRDQLLRHFPSLENNPRQFAYCSSLDIDQAWKYRHKGWYRNLGGAFRDFRKRDWPLVKERYSVLAGRQQDPYDNFAWQFTLHREYPETQIQYFILIGDHGSFDKNCSHEHPAFQKLLTKLHAHHGPLGVHPSYGSNASPEKITEEMARLEAITGEKPVRSRQHFLMHRMPQTYHQLLSAGIEEDHTMGYSTHAGFRAGIAAPFYFYDLHKNIQTLLRIVPFCLMDITHLHYEQLNAEESIRSQSALMDEVASVGGLFCSLWHNESLSENGRWKGRRQVYEALFKEGSERMLLNAHK